MEPGAAPTALNTVQLHLSNMHAFTATTHKQYVIGNVSCRMQFVVSQCLELAAHISKLSIALNERQIDFFAQMVRGNLSERAVCSSGDVCRASSRRDKPQKRRSSLQSVGRTVACSVMFDGICLEYLLSDGGYAYTASGDDMYQSVGSVRRRSTVCRNMQRNRMSAFMRHFLKFQRFRAAEGQLPKLRVL